jgi:hypothetical protein
MIFHQVDDVLVPSSIADHNPNVAHGQPDVTMGNENDGAIDDVVYNSSSPTTFNHTCPLVTIEMLCFLSFASRHK